MKVGCSENGMILDEEAGAETSVSLGGYLDGISSYESTTVHE